MMIWSKSKRVFNKFVKRFIYFGRNSSIQGLKYIFQKDGTPISRVIWLLLLLVFCGGLYLLLMPVVQRGGSVSVTLDTNYLDWNTKFPAVTVCEKYSLIKVSPIITEYYLDLLGKHTTRVHDNKTESIKGHISDIVYGRGHCLSSDCSPNCNIIGISIGNTSVPCDLRWTPLIHKVRKECSEMISNCYFNNVEFSCCEPEYFKIVDSEYGSCYSFNSLQGSNTTEGLQFFVNSSTGPGALSFHLLYDAQISVHSSEELSTNFLAKKLYFDVALKEDQVVDYLFSIVEVDNEAVLENEGINVRKCRYKHEIPDLPLHTYQVYSYGGCRLARSTQETFNICHCVHPVRDKRYEDVYCNYTGILCLLNIESSKKTSVSRDKSDAVDAVDCLPSCVESELNKIHISRLNSSSVIHSKNSTDQYNMSLINIRMVSLPTLRYKKSLLRTNLDFVVTIGGMVGLFFSASILSFAEIFYLILRSPNNNK